MQRTAAAMGRRPHSRLDISQVELTNVMQVQAVRVVAGDTLQECVAVLGGTKARLDGLACSHKQHRPRNTGCQQPPDIWPHNSTAVLQSAPGQQTDQRGSLILNTEQADERES